CTPNADSYQVAQEKWFFLHLGLEHVAYFSNRSLASLARDHDMIVEHVRTDICPFYLPYTYRSYLARVLLEPRKVLTNKWQRSRWRFAAESKWAHGLNLHAILRKKDHLQVHSRSWEANKSS